MDFQNRVGHKMGTGGLVLSASLLYLFVVRLLLLLLLLLQLLLLLLSLHSRCYLVAVVPPVTLDVFAIQMTMVVDYLTE